MPKDTHKDIRCSFCGKPQDEVTRLVEGPGVYICDGCISYCNSLLFEDENAYNSGKKAEKKKEEYNLPTPEPEALAPRLQRGRRVLQLCAHQPVSHLPGLSVTRHITRDWTSSSHSILSLLHGH